MEFDGEDVKEVLSLTYDHITVLQRPMDITGEVLISSEGMADYSVFVHE
jgi:hypothetical protein